MNKKFLLIPALALGLAALGGFAMASVKTNVKAANAYSDTDGYTATSDHFVASFNRNNALRNAYNGDDNEGDSTRLENITISDMDHTSNISWKVSIGKYSYDTFRNLKMGNKGKTIEGHSDSEFAAIYTATGVATGHYMSAMYTTSAISNIQDFFVSWGAQGGQLHESAFGDIYFLCKLNDGWHLIKSWNAGYGDNDRGTASTWNHVQAKMKNDVLANANVLGENAQLAIAYDSGTDGTKNSFVCLHTIMVNRVASAKATLHYWDKMGNDLEVCTYLNDQKANNTVKVALFANRIEQIHVDGGDYNSVAIDGLNVSANFAYSRAKENTYYAQLAYLCGVAGISLAITPSSSNVLASIATNNSTIIVLASTIALSIVCGGLLLSIYKKKHN